MFKPRGLLPSVLGKLLRRFLPQVEHEHMVRIVVKTWGKMSLVHALALTLPMNDACATLVKRR